MKIVDPREDSEWDADVASHVDATIFHSRAWAEVLCRTYGHTPYYVRFTTDGRRAGLVPLMEVSSIFTGRRGVCVPFSDFCDPLIFHEAASPDSVIQSISRVAKDRGWKYFELRGTCRNRTSADASRQAGTRPQVEPELRAAGVALGESSRSSSRKPPPPSSKAAFARFYTHLLDLRSSPDQLLSATSSSVRRAIRKAQKSGLSVEIADSAQGMRQFSRLHTRTRRRHNLPPQPMSFFKNIHEHIIKRGLGFTVVAHQKREPIAAAIFLHFGKNSLYKFGASDERYQALRGNNLVMWHSIKHLAQQGFRMLHLGRTDVEHNGLRRYKLSLGCEEGLACYFRYEPRNGNPIHFESPPRPASTLLFRILPERMNRLAGALLYPHLH